MPSSEQRPITPFAVAVALMCAALWGGTSVAIRFTQDVYPPLLTAAMRFGLSCIFMAAWCRLQGETFAPRSGQGRAITVVGVLLFLQIGLFHWGLTRTNSSHGSVLIGSHPVMVALVAHFALHGDRLSWPKATGMAIAAAGLVSVVSAAARTTSSPDATSLLGDTVILTSSCLLAVKTVYTKRALSFIEPGKLILWSNLMGAVLLFGYSLLFEDWSGAQPTASAVLALLYQGFVVAGFCFAAWTAILRRHRASELAVFAFAQPLFGILFGNRLRGDALSLPLVGGALLVAAGIVMVTRAGAREAARTAGRPETLPADPTTHETDVTAAPRSR